MQIGEQFLTPIIESWTNLASFSNDKSQNFSVQNKKKVKTLLISNLYFIKIVIPTTSPSYVMVAIIALECYINERAA